MLTPQLLDGVKAHTSKLKKTVTFVLATGEHEKRAELLKFLTDLSSVSDKLAVEERAHDALRSPISFLLEVDGKDTGIRFSGIPGGHEFSSLVIAFIQAGSGELKLDESVKNIVQKINTPLTFETYVSLSCHNCPDVVQALNQFALLNDNITNEMIDGGLFQELVEAKGIQGVPSVYLNDEVFANGQIDTAKLLEKLLEQFPDALNNDAPTQALPLQDVTVIGGGPAGVAAAIYSARKGLIVTMVADRFGGQVKDTMDIENLISTPLTTGPKLTSAMDTHMGEYSITKREHIPVERVEVGDDEHVLILKTGERIRTKTIIVATGAKWRELGVPGEKENIGNGVAYCPHCDGPFYKGKDIAVMGGGNSGVEAALDLAGIVKSVTVFEFMDSLKADQVLVDKLHERDNVNVITHAATKTINATNGKVSSVTYINREDESEHTLDLEGVFVQIGLVPNSQFLDGVVERTQYGEIVVNEKGETNVKGIFACGDVTTVPYKQIIIAMGEGAKASLAAYDYLLMNA